MPDEWLESVTPQNDSIPEVGRLGEIQHCSARAAKMGTHYAVVFNALSFGNLTVELQYLIWFSIMLSCSKRSSFLNSPIDQGQTLIFKA